MISEITGEVLYDRIRHNSLLLRVNSMCYEVFVPSGIASRLRHAPEGDRRNPLTLYTIYYIDGGLGGGHLTPKLVGFLDPLDRLAAVAKRFVGLAGSVIEIRHHNCVGLP